MALRTPFLQWIMILLPIVAIASPGAVFAARMMVMQATFNHSQNEQGFFVVIAGRVFDSTNSSIPNAVISVQVNNPQGTSIHLAVAYTNPDGDFRDTFSVAPISPGGNYTAFLVADKPGYDTARLTLTFSYLSPDFSLQAAVQTLSIQQGQTGTLTLTILSLRGFKDSVNLTALELPAGVSLHFKPASLNPSGTTTVTVIASGFTPAGNYTITVLGISGSFIHTISFQLIVTPGPFRAIYVFLAASVIIAVAFLVLRQRKRRRREAVLEELIKQGTADEGYVATARVIARLEELRAMNRVDESTYQRLRKEYEKRLEKSK